jgi:putative PIN family toxin of toxin-antitoxin system
MTPAVFVVDTNVVAGGLITARGGSPVAVVLDAMVSGSLVYLLSLEVLAEYRSVLLRPKLVERHGLTESEVDRLLVELAANAMWREPEGGARAPDRGDDHLSALLAAYPGSVLVTGEGLLPDNPPTPGAVISPRTCVDRFLAAER